MCFVWEGKSFIMHHTSFVRRSMHFRDRNVSSYLCQKVKNVNIMQGTSSELNALLILGLNTSVNDWEAKKKAHPNQVIVSTGHFVEFLQAFSRYGYRISGLFRTT